MPLARYWGPRLPDGIDLTVLPWVLQRPLPQAGLDRDVPPTLCPEFGFGWFGTPALLGSRDRRDWASACELVGYEASGQRAILLCRDTACGLELTLEIELDAATGVLSRRTVLSNIGSGDFRLDWCAAGAFALPARCAEVLNFESQWSQEFQERRRTLALYALIDRQAIQRRFLRFFPPETVLLLHLQKI
jgi:alpha-galactosidase